MTNIELEKIIPDVRQPRKTFDRVKMASLKESIRTHGIMNPLRVQKKKDGTFLLEDGERRYRVAKELKLKEVPAVVVNETNDVQRLISQFHIQEQHENWSPVEKAMAIDMMTEETGMSYKELGQLLGIPERTVRTYEAFSKIIDKDRFVAHEVNIGLAAGINLIRKTAERIYKNEEWEYNRSIGRKIESTIIKGIDTGDIRVIQDLTKIKDSFNTDHKSVEKFIGGDITPSELFSETKAQGAFYLRNLISTSRSVRTYITGYMKSRNAPRPDSHLISDIKSTKARIEEFLNKVE